MLHTAAIGVSMPSSCNTTPFPLVLPREKHSWCRNGQSCVPSMHGSVETGYPADVFFFLHPLTQNSMVCYLPSRFTTVYHFAEALSQLFVCSVWKFLVVWEKESTQSLCPFAAGLLDYRTWLARHVFKGTAEEELAYNHGWGVKFFVGFPLCWKMGTYARGYGADSWFVCFFFFFFLPA